MEICMYDLVLDEKKHTVLQVKESFSCHHNKFHSADAIAGFMRESFGIHRQADEYVYMLAFNTDMNLLGIFEISHGTGTASLVDARGIFMRALQVGATNIILVHNHPSGNVSPSKEDIALTERIKRIGNLMAIPLIDHLIIGDDDCISFHEKELL